MTYRALSDASLSRLGEHLRSIKSMADSAASLSDDVAELSGLTADALAEYETLLETKQNLPATGTLTIPTTGWASDAGIGGRFKYAITIALADVEATDEVNLFFDDAAGIAASSACGLAAWTESLTGGIRLRAAKLPTQNFSVRYEINKPQAVNEGDE